MHHYVIELKLSPTDLYLVNSITTTLKTCNSVLKGKGPPKKKDRDLRTKKIFFSPTITVPLLTTQPL